MSNMRILFLSILLVLSLSFSASVMLASAYSETFPLVESASVSRIVFANAGDRIVGDFTVSNVPSWNDHYTGNPTTVQYAFIIVKIEGTEYSSQDIEVFRATQTEHSSFDINCQWTGNYRLRFNVGSGVPGPYVGLPTKGIGDMKASLNYNVVAPSSNGLPDEQSTSEPIEISPAILAGIVTFIIIVLGGLGIYLFTRSRHKTQSAA